MIYKIFPNPSFPKMGNPLKFQKNLKRKKIDELLVIGYKETCKEDKEINKDWESVTLDGWKK